MTQRIGFVGIGLMGHGAARNLADKGFPLAFMAHRNRAPAEDLKARGAREVASVADLAAASDTVFLCLPSSVEVEAIVLGSGGLAAHGRPGMTVVDMTTSEPASTRRIGAALAARGMGMIDAPLGRTPTDAQAGRLNAMVGGDDATLARVRPALDAFCENVFHVGALGMGHTVKLINNMIGLGTMAVVAEAVVAAARAGVDLGRLRDVVAAGGATSAMFVTMMRSLVDGDAQAGRFALANACKDVRYFARLVAEPPMATPVAAAVLQDYGLALAQGRGAEFLPRLADALAAANGVTLPRR
jgi:3-hydroxyisobutyrate dehydrogenase-like beta-hydroxyacid dehydrogenase